MTDATDLPDIDALLAERDALHGWLAKLDASPVAAPDAVRARVRQDYQDRLDGVTDRLGAHAGTVAERLAADRAEHAELVAQATAAREALAEAELRHAVGEYDDARFEAERVRHTSDLEAFELSREAVSERITQLEEVEALITAAPRPEPVAAEEPAPAPEAEAPYAEERPVEAPAPEPAAESAGSDEAELDSESLLSVFEVEEAPAPEPPPAPEAAPLSFTPRGGAPAPLPPLGLPADEPPRFSPPATPPPADPPVVPLFAAGMVPEVEDEQSGEPEATPRETGPKTVRCGECGAMNRPLEWYCEQCGAELTAV